MSDNNKKNKILAMALAWLCLVIIAIFLFVIIYALMTGNGKLALAFIIGLIFLSIVIWVGIRLYKKSLSIFHK